jgi:voltage-dependent potassium channel beta subunit
LEYRRLGRSGLRISQFSLGSWVTFGQQVDVAAARELMAAACDAGVNFFDNAEVYAKGQSEQIMGEALRQLGWPRLNYVVSTKFFWGLDRAPAGQPPRPNRQDTLNRKYLLQSIDGSLRRLGLDHVDIVYCHRPDPHTPIDETVGAMHDLIRSGKALYWGTSEWPAAAIREALAVAERHHLHKPVVEQPQYNLFHRARVEWEYASLVRQHGLGLTTWSPLASGLLTGKYRQGLPAGSRGADERNAYLRQGLLDARRNAAVAQLEPLAAELGGSLAQLALAWATHNPAVSSVILGASNAAQLQENLGALALLPRLTPGMVRRIEAVVAPWRRQALLKEAARASGLLKLLGREG